MVSKGLAKLDVSLPAGKERGRDKSNAEVAITPKTVREGRDPIGKQDKRNTR
jgi:hypothetical protein